MRVLRIFSRLNIGGPSVHVILLTQGLAARGYETRLVVGQETTREGNMLDLAAEKGVHCEQLAGLGREIRPMSDLRSLIALIRLVRKYRPDIVHTHTAKAGILGRVAARAAGRALVVHTFHGHVLRGYFGPAKTAFFRLLERILAGMSDALIAVSDTVKADLVEFGVAPAEKIQVVPLGLELTHLAGELPRGGLRGPAAVGPTAPLVGIVGRLVPIKDVPTFLEMAALVVRERPTVRFAVVGDGEERAALEAKAAVLGVGGIVHFHGWRRDLTAVYGDLDVVVNSSRNEGTPVSLIEALAARRPVVATSVGGTPDLLGREERGWLVPPADPQRLAGAVLKALDRPEDAATRALAGQQHVLRTHAVARLLDDVDRLYQRLIEARRP